MQRIIQNSDFHLCYVVSVLTDEIHQFLGGNYSEFTCKMKLWMRDEVILDFLYSFLGFTAQNFIK